MNLGIVILEYSRAIMEEKIHWWDNLVIQYIQELFRLAVPRPEAFLSLVKDHGISGIIDSKVVIKLL